jgi:very-short-patch-repair endonuclease
VALEELERLHGAGEDELLAFLKSETGRSLSALKKRLPPAAPLPPSPLLPQGEQGEQERWEVPDAIRRKMVEVARQFRKEPTPSEDILWQALRGRKLEGRKFRRQQPIGSFVVDFFCAAERLIVEVDGGIHETQKDLDQQRQELLESLGLRFVRVSSKLIETDLPQTLTLIKDHCSATPLSRSGRGAGGEGPDLDPHDRNQFLIACNNDPDLFKRVLPWAELMRRDTFGQPIVIPAGSVFVTQGTDRRETGTHYTPKTLTEEIVKYTLEPLVYAGVAEGKAKEDWRLKSAAELLALKVCDMAMGSGAFLAQVCRYLSERLVEAWEMEIDPLPPNPLLPQGEQGEQETPPVPLSLDGRGARGEGARGAGGEGFRILPAGLLSAAEPGEAILPNDPDERLAVARRIVADRCIYGVDKNPMAVEMAKLSLWLITLQKNRHLQVFKTLAKKGFRQSAL